MANTEIPVVRPHGNRTECVPELRSERLSGAHVNGFLSSIEIFIPKSNMNRFFKVHPVDGHECYDPANPYQRGSLRPGDRVVVDLTDKKPTWPGPFLVRIGEDMTVKYLQSVPHNGSRVLQMCVRNPAFSQIDIPLEEADIVGRVRGAVVNL